MNKLIWSVVLFTGIILLLIFAGFFMNEQVYKKVGIIDDKHEVLRKVSDSLPVQVTISHQKWGSLIVNDEVSLHSLVSYVDRIKQEYEPRLSTDIDSEQAILSGRIQYLNGSEETFELSSTFTLGKWSYGPGHETPLLSALQTQLQSFYYTPEHFAQFIRNAERITFRSNGEQESLLDHEKGYLVTSISQALEIKDLVEIKQLLLHKQMPLGSITAYKEDKKLINDRSNLLHIVVYSDYVVMQYMGDDNGNSIYLQAGLEELLHGKNTKADIR
ncbi:DUF3919 family protein [Paenibacillus sp. D2_2]|uniref:DUF3919 family protein n=1 Tax=Paenibacillus sp. D2_2 TaxID=3073092 RepID=UPI00281508E8|nr:DUF3919 family protein [Paenibacillus sp. D2_2]WMT43223.1 DUF3919 family protein [Paenibacillus sp. D2_2]